MIVAERQCAQLPAEALAASVIMARFAPAITTPVTQRLGNSLEPRAVHEHRPALPHRDVVGRVKAARRQIAERANLLAFVSRTDRVATIFDKPQIVLLCKCDDRVEIKWIAQRM